MTGNTHERRSKKRARRAVARGARDDGAAAVEMALVLPILAVFLFGIIIFGYLMSFRGTVAQAADEAARQAATAPRTADHSTETTRAKAAADRVMGGYNKSCGAVDLATGLGATSANGLRCDFVVFGCPTSDGANHDCMRVTLTYAYSTQPLLPDVPVVSMFLPTNIVVSSTVRMNDS